MSSHQVKTQPVLLAPVPADVLASAAVTPHLHDEVAFGTRQAELPFAAGTPVFIYAVPSHERRRVSQRPRAIEWRGTLGRVTLAVPSGPRRGMHPVPVLRPPFAEAYDYKDAVLFWHVHGLKRLREPIPFDRFRGWDGAKLFGGLAPQWIAAACLHPAPLSGAARQAA